MNKKMPRRSCLTVAEKLRIVEYAEAHRVSLRAMARVFNVGKSHIGEILKRKAEILQAAAEGAQSPKTRRCHRVKEEEGESERTGLSW